MALIRRVRAEVSDIAVCTCTPSASMRRCKAAAPPASSCTAMRRGAASTTCATRPSLRNAFRGFEAEQTAADDCTHAADTTARRSHAVARDPRSCGRRTRPVRRRRRPAVRRGTSRRENQLVVREYPAAVGGQGARVAVDLHDTLAEQQRHARSFVGAGLDEREIVDRSVVEERAQAATRSYAGIGSSPKTTTRASAARPRSTIAASTKR